MQSAQCNAYYDFNDHAQRRTNTTEEMVQDVASRQACNASGKEKEQERTKKKKKKKTVELEN